MDWNHLIRQSHRWLSIAFTIGVITNVVSMRDGSVPPQWVGLLALGPLIVLLFSGLYLFVLPYAAKWRARRAS